MDKIDALLTLEQAGQLPPEQQTALTYLRETGQLAEMRATPPGTPRLTPPPQPESHPFAEGGGAMVGSTIGQRIGTAVAPFAGPVGPAMPLVGGLVGAGAGALGGRMFADEDRAYAPRERGEVVERAIRGEAFGQVFGKGLSLAGRAYRDIARTTPRALQITRGIQHADELAARTGVPMAASERTGSTVLRRLENVPTYFMLGPARTLAFREGQREGFERAVEGTRDALVSGVADRSAATADTLTAGIMAQAGTRGVLKNWRAQKSLLFEELETLAGDAPVVPTTRLKSTINAIIKNTTRTPMGAPKAAQRLAGALPDDAAGGVAYAAQLRGLGLSDDAAAAAERALTADNIPFAEARRIQAELGELAFGDGRPVGGIQSGRLKAMWAASDDDINAFLTSEAGSDVAPALAEAKQVYSTGKELFNGSAKRLVIGQRNQGVAPERVISRVFAPGNVSDTLDFKQLVDDDTYAIATRAWLDDLIQQSSTNDAFDPIKFTLKLKRYDKNGHLDVILPPEATAALRDVVEQVNTIKRVAGPATNWSGTGQAGASLAQVGAILGSGHQMAQGRIGQALLTAVNAIGVPYGIARATTTPQGIEAITDAYAGGGRNALGATLDMLGPSTARLVSQALAQGTADPPLDLSGEGGTAGALAGALLEQGPPTLDLLRTHRRLGAEARP